MQRESQDHLINSDGPVRVETLHEAHPRIRAEDWRSPLIARLLDEAQYSDGEQAIRVSYKDEKSAVSEEVLGLAWSGIRIDYEKCLRTYQAPNLTEYAALGLACILCNQRRLEITEVTRRGEKVDYWLGDRESLLEVSGTAAGDLEALCETKATEQLRVNPLGKDGFVCVARFRNPAARLWYYKRNHRNA